MIDHLHKSKNKQFFKKGTLEPVTLLNLVPLKSMSSSWIISLYFPLILFLLRKWPKIIHRNAQKRSLTVQRCSGKIESS